MIFINMKLVEIFNEVIYDNIFESKKLPDGGDCFNSSYDYMVNDRGKTPNLKLVHGFVSGQGKLYGYRFAHGWCETDDMVIDNSNNKKREVPKFLYYSIGNIVPSECKYYTYTDLLDFSTKVGHKGPWGIENKHYKEKWNR